MDLLQMIVAALGAPALIDLYDRGQIFALERQCPLYDFYFGQGEPEPMPSDSIEWIEFPTVRDVARSSRRGRKPNQVTGVGFKMNRAGMFRIFEEFTINPMVGTLLRDPAQWRVESGIRMVGQLFRHAGTRHLNNKRVIGCKMLQGMDIFYDDTLDIVETQVTTDLTVPTPVAASHKGLLSRATLGLTGTGNIFDTPITDPACDFFNMAEEVLLAADIAGSLPPMHWWMNSIHKRDFAANTKFNAWYNPKPNIAPMDEQFLPDTVVYKNGITLHFMREGYQDASNAHRPYIAPKTIAMLPNAGGEWLRKYAGVEIEFQSYGTQAVPATSDPVEMVLAAYRQAREVFGKFARIIREDRGEARITGQVGENFGFVLTDPNSVWVASWT